MHLMQSLHLFICKTLTFDQLRKQLTSFCSHQKKALTFMMKREQGWQYDGSQEDLWVKEVDETGHMT